eukprot:7422863-Alexandrium_andersonii.AAC.1
MRGVVRYEGDFEPPAFGHLRSPAEINMYSDGSLMWPMHPDLRYGGAAAVLPRGLDYGRDDLEEFRCFARGSSCSLALRASLLGCAASAARAETLGLLVSALVPTPVHIGIDCAAVTKRLNGLKKAEAAVAAPPPQVPAQQRVPMNWCDA